MAKSISYFRRYDAAHKNTNVYKVTRDYNNGPITKVTNMVTGDEMPLWTQTVTKLQKRSKAFEEMTEREALRLLEGQSHG